MLTPDVQPRTTSALYGAVCFPKLSRAVKKKSVRTGTWLSHGGGTLGQTATHKERQAAPIVVSGGGGVSRVVLRGRGRRPSPSRRNFADFNRVASFPVLRFALGPPADECRTTAAAINKRHPTVIVAIYVVVGGGCCKISTD